MTPDSDDREWEELDWNPNPTTPVLPFLAVTVFIGIAVTIEILPPEVIGEFTLILTVVFLALSGLAVILFGRGDSS